MFFEVAGRRVGSLPVNLIRLVMAIVFLSAVSAVLRGRAFPTDATAHQWVWLSISGLVGFTFGDMCLFRAFVVLGPRLSTLFMALAPPMAALMSWAMLGETLGLTAVLGMVLTLSGVAMAVLERAPGTNASTRLSGVLLGLGGAFGQAAGLVLSKYGMGDYAPIAATQIRTVAGLAGFAVLFAFIGVWPRVALAARDRAAMKATAWGAVCGPFIGVTLSLVAVKYTDVGVAASIMATTPILIIPAVIVFRRERVGPLAVVGAALAVVGVALLFA